MLVISGSAFIIHCNRLQLSFNLAIEMLVISGKGQSPGAAASDGFNLAIEMLVISGTSDLTTKRSLNCFNLAIEMLVISGRYLNIPSRNNSCHVSISQSRCLSFQVRACGASDTPWLNTRTSASVHFQHDGAC